MLCDLHFTSVRLSLSSAMLSLLLFQVKKVKIYKINLGVTLIVFALQIIRRRFALCVEFYTEKSLQNRFSVFDLNFIFACCFRRLHSVRVRSDNNFGVFLKMKQDNAVALI